MTRGSCLCGEVVWEFETPLVMMSHCHCTMCRKIHGSAFGTYAMGSAEGFRFRSGEGLLSHFESSAGNRRRFCAKCGSLVPGEPHDGLVATPAGNHDDDPGVRPVAHIYTGSKAPWHPITDALPQFESMPPGFDAPVIERPVAPAAQAGALRGSCLCGDVAYEVSGEVRGIVLCHCSRCRKSRSAAFGANLWVSDARFEWIAGGQRVAHYKVPDADRYTNFFCDRCGSTVTRGLSRGGQLTVPAGNIDGGAGLVERIHIFVGSKAPWFEITDTLPQLDRSPGGSGGQALDTLR